MPFEVAMGLAEPRLKVGIIDANPLLADGIAALLQQCSDFIAETVSPGQLQHRLEREGFDVILVDPAQSAIQPTELVRDLSSISNGLLAYSSSGCESLARSCIRAGFRGVVPKTVSIDLLKIALATVASGGIFIDAAFAAVVAPGSGADDAPIPAKDASLSERELFVLRSVAYGKSMKEIGKELDLSSKTVETYKARGSNKLNLSGRRQIVEFAIAQGWVATTPLTAD